MKNGRHWQPLEVAAKSERMLSRDEEQRLARAAHRGDDRALDHLVRAHIPLVFAMAFEYRAGEIPLDELVSEGLLGLVKAARDFDPERGTRFASYAAWWIRAYLRTYTIANRRIVRGPSTRVARHVRAHLRKTERALGQTCTGPVKIDDLARALGVRPEDIEETRAVLGGRDVPCGVTIDGRTFDVAADGPSPEAESDAAERRRTAARLVKDAVSALDVRGQRIIQRRHLGDSQSSFNELGAELGASRERVRQLELDAKARMRSQVATTTDATQLQELLCA